MEYKKLLVLLFAVFAISCGENSGFKQVRITDGVLSEAEIAKTLLGLRRSLPSCRPSNLETTSEKCRTDFVSLARPIVYNQLAICRENHQEADPVKCETHWNLIIESHNQWIAENIGRLIPTPPVVPTPPVLDEKEISETIGILEKLKRSVQACLAENLEKNIVPCRLDFMRELIPIMYTQFIECRKGHPDSNDQKCDARWKIIREWIEKNLIRTGPFQDEKLVGPPKIYKTLLVARNKLIACEKADLEKTALVCRNHFVAVAKPIVDGNLDICRQDHPKANAQKCTATWNSILKSHVHWIMDQIFSQISDSKTLTDERIRYNFYPSVFNRTFNKKESDIEKAETQELYQEISKWSADPTDNGTTKKSENLLNEVIGFGQKVLSKIKKYSLRVKSRYKDPISLDVSP